MNITYVDADTREIIDIFDDPVLTIFKVEAEGFAASLGATILKFIPEEEQNEWTIELKIPLAVRRSHTPLPGDGVRFSATIGGSDHKMTGVYQFTRGCAYVILDDQGVEWELENMWQMKKL